MTRSGRRAWFVRGLLLALLGLVALMALPAPAEAGVNPNASLLRNVRNCGAYQSPYHPGKKGCWWYKLDLKLERAIPQICSLSAPRRIPRVSNPNDPNYVGVYSGERGYVGVRIDWTITSQFWKLKRRWCTGSPANDNGQNAGQTASSPGKAAPPPRNNTASPPAGQGGATAVAAGGVNPNASLLRNVRNCGAYQSPYHPGKKGCWWYKLDLKLERAIPQICSLSAPRRIPRVSNPNDPNYVGVYSGERGYVGVRIDWTITSQFWKLKRRWCTGSPANDNGQNAGQTASSPGNIATTTATSPSPPPPAPTSGGSVTWASGMHCWPKGGYRPIERWRGVPVRVSLIFLDYRRWLDEASARRLAERHRNLARRMDIAITTPLLPNPVKRDFAGCVAGRYDENFRAFARGLAQGGLPRAYIRLAAEFQLKAEVRANPTGFVRCFRRAVTMMRSVAPSLRIEWSPNRAGKAETAQRLVQKYWPGDEYVDAVNLSFYDFSPSARNLQTWNVWFGPELDWWASFVRSKGKKLNFGEWGLYHRDDGFDNPLFIEKMFDFFSRNRDVIGYEVYFNCDGTRGRLYPVRYNPRSSETYRRLWKGS